MTKRYGIVDIERDGGPFAYSFVDACDTLERAQDLITMDTENKRKKVWF